MSKLKTTVSLAAVCISAASFAETIRMVSTVSELRSAVAACAQGDTIIIKKSGSPYNLGEVDCLSQAAHLYFKRGQFVLKGETGDPADVVLVGTTNRIAYFYGDGNQGILVSGITFKNGDCRNTPRVTSIEGKSNDSWALSYDNNKGGAVMLRQDHANVTFEDCVFDSNRAAGDGGGAVANYYSADTTRWGGRFVNCRFVNNQSGYGGAVFGCQFVSNCVFEANAGTHGGAIYHPRSVYGCVFSSNTAATVGNAIAWKKGKLSALKIVDSSFEGESTPFCCDDNSKSAGEAVFVNCSFEGKATVNTAAFLNGSYDRCRFENILPTVADGWYYLFGETASLTNCLINGCKRAYFLYNPTVGCGFYNCTLVNNRFYWRWYAGGSSEREVLVENCLFANNHNGETEEDLMDVYNAESTKVKRFDNCFVAVASGLASFDGANNVNTYNKAFDPRFVGGAADPSDPYSLQWDSPARKKEGLLRDWMETATDIRGAGYARLRDGKVNIGCYQCWLPPSGMMLIFR